jgi:hypothetical protein
MKVVPSMLHEIRTHSCVLSSVDVKITNEVVRRVADFARLSRNTKNTTARATSIKKMTQAEPSRS